MRAMNGQGSGSQRRDLLLASVFIAVVTFLHYTTGGGKVEFHTLYRYLYFVPIIYISFRYGLKLGIFTSFIISALYAPHVYDTWKAQPGVNLGNLLQIPVFIGVGAVMGYLSDQERERQYEARKTESMASLGRAALTMSRELRQILADLKKTLSSMEVGAETRQGLADSIDRIAVLEQALSDFGSESPAFAPDSLDLDTVLKRIARSLEALAKSSRVELRMGAIPLACTVNIKEEDMQWVLTEVVKNAIEASPPGGVVEVSVEKMEGGCRIRVVDQGEGIPPEHLAMVFIPFYTTKPGGSGLALAACKKIVHEAKGTIQIQSQVGQGTEVTIELPCRQSL